MVWNIVYYFWIPVSGCFCETNSGKVMSSPVVPDAGGLAVIHQVNTKTDQRNGPERQQSFNTPASLPKPIATFYSGEPELLGTTQIFAGIILLSLGLLITIVFTQTTYYIGFAILTGIPLWPGVLFIISGSLSVSASVKPTVGKIKSSLVMNILGAVAAALGIMFTAFEIFVPYYTPSTLVSPYCAHYQSDMQCIGNFVVLPVYKCILSFIIILLTLMFCITISTSVFACKAVCRTSLQNMTVVIYQNTSLTVTDPTRDLPPDSEAAMTSDLKTQT
ncbi:membrane-spanning 4-domains subfamily A member 4A-like isoform X1 [Leptodactylus fuscus]|uniref:membrane-spanning 4-domains subfamily A member 4A-like isoform X1 n=1 Tax=Leptodactylus fuscus TaxID=238119 RepID=UPI003F4ED9CC